MDLAEREAFFAAGGGGGGYDGPPGGGMPPPNRPPLNNGYHDEQTPGGNWGPSPDNRVTTREALAKQRQNEYNEHLQRQEHQREMAHQARHSNGQGQGQGRPPMHQNNNISPGLQFDEEQRPRPKGFHGLRDIHNTDEKRRVKKEEQKKQYARELQQQIDFKNQKKFLDKQHSLELDRHNLGMQNIITDMHDGVLDGVDENGNQMGYSYADAHPVDEPRSYHDQKLETPLHQQNQSGAYDGSGPKGFTNAANAARENQAYARGSLSVMDNGGGNPAPRVPPPGGHWRDGVDQGKLQEKARKKAEYQRDLDRQIAEKNLRKQAEKRQIEEQDMRHEQAAQNYNPYGRAGGGAPVRDAQGAVRTNLRGGPDGGIETYGQQYGGQGDPSSQQHPGNMDQTTHQYGAPPPQGSLPYPDHGGDAYPPIVPGGRAGVPGRSQVRNSNYGNPLNPGASNPNPAPGSATRGITNFRTENENPAALEAKHRQREELQHALRLQIEEKRLRKEEEKRELEREEAAEERRLQLEQERLRDAFEREQQIERQKAEERMRAEEEAYQAAANKRQERIVNDKPPMEEVVQRPPVQQRVSENEMNQNAQPQQQQQYQQQPPPQQVPLPPRGHTPAGARELNQLRNELQHEHKELMVAMRQQNANMAILSRRAEMAEKHSAEARVELAEMRENLADQAFISALPPTVSSGDPLAHHGVDIPIYMSKTSDPLEGPPHVSTDEDYGVFMRDASGPHHRENDLGPALDEGAPFVALGSSANDLAGQLGKHMGVGSPGRHNPSAKLLIRRGGMDVDDDVGSIVGDSAFIFPGQTMERAPFLKGSGQSVFSGPGAERPAPSVGPGGMPRHRNGEISNDGGVGISTRFGGPDRALGGDPYDDGPDGAGLSTRDADLSHKLDAAYQKNAARMRALGVGVEAGNNSGNNNDSSDPDQLEGLLQNFLRANRDNGGVVDFDAVEPPSMNEGPFDDPSDGLNVQHADDDDFGLGRPNTQMSMQAETRFVGSQY